MQFSVFSVFLVESLNKNDGIYGFDNLFERGSDVMLMADFGFELAFYV